MESPEEHPERTELPEKARRAILTIRIVMAVMILAPTVLAWLTGGLRF